MYHKVLKIGRWVVDFLFAIEKYDVDGVIGCLYDADASHMIIERACDIMYEDRLNCGFTFANPEIFRAVIVVGPTSSGSEFIDTLTHEVHHLAVAIAKELNFDLDGEVPAYITGDSLRELAYIICKLGCIDKPSL